MKPSEASLLDHEARLRFVANVRREPECWLWTGSVHVKGYGDFTQRRGREELKFAHRASFILFVGPIPEGAHVLHRCDNRLCVRPSHLFLGTNADNVADRQQKGRTARGERHPNSRLKPHHVIAIRDQVESGESKSSVAREYGIDEAQVRRIVKRQSWGHVD